MDVTRENFFTVLPKIKEAVENCLFYSIDLEMTGVQLPGFSVLSTESPEERYQIHKNVSESFQPLQFGLCTFEKSSDSEVYVAKPFTFYLYPDPNSPEELRFFSSQSNTLTFLAKSNFNFSKWIAGGIHFRRFFERELDEDSSKSGFTSAYFSSNASFITQLREQLYNFCIDKEAAALKIKPKDFKESNVIRNEAYLICGNKVVITEEGNHLRIEKPTLLNKKSNGSLSTKKISPDQVHFNHITEILLKSKKPLVGHNCYLDLCFVLNHFFKELPNSLVKFKSQVTDLFPRVIDTKYLSSYHPKFKDFRGPSSLEALVERFSVQPYAETNFRITYEEEMGAYLRKEGDKYHDAGFDALYTGKVLLNMMSFILSEDKEDRIVDFSKISTHCNKLYHMKSEFPVLDISGEEPTPEPQFGKFLISPIPEKIHYTDIVSVFKQIDLKVSRVFFNSGSCWVIFEPKVDPDSENTSMKEPDTQLFSIIPTGKFEDLWSEGLLRKPEPKLERVFRQANIYSWFQWLESIQTNPVSSTEPSSVSTGFKTTEEESSSNQKQPLLQPVSNNKRKSLDDSERDTFKKFKTEE